LKDEIFDRKESPLMDDKKLGDSLTEINESLGQKSNEVIRCSAAR
jgi:hypothetical protein